MGLRILVVEDNADTAACLSFLCQSWGHQVRLAADGLSAIESALEFRPEVVLLDIGLPSMDGFEVMEHLRSHSDFGRTFIIACSGFHSENDRRRAQQLGVDLFLVKPFDPWQLEEVFVTFSRSSLAIPA